MESQQHQRQVLLQHRWWGNELRFDSGFRFSQVGQIHFEDVSRNVTNIKNMREYYITWVWHFGRSLVEIPAARHADAWKKRRWSEAAQAVFGHGNAIASWWTKTDHLALMNHETSTPLPNSCPNDIFVLLQGTERPTRSLVQMDSVI